MAHNHAHHGHSHHAHQGGDTTGNIRTAFFINLAFTIIEIFGGLFTNSIAILSDALHDLGDTLSLGLAWYFQKKSEKGPDSRYTFGFRRFSLLGAVVNSIVLVIGSIYMLTEAIPRLFAPEETKALYMMGLAVLGVAFNGYAAWKLSHGSSLNERAVRLHLLEDVLGWVAVLIGSIFIYFFEWYIIDPILSVFIMVYILSNVYKNLRDSFRVLLQAKPEGLDLDALHTELEAIEGVENIHDLHAWTMDGEYVVLTLHISSNLKEVAAIQALRKQVREAVAKHNIEHVTTEVHPPGEECDYLDCE